MLHRFRPRFVPVAALLPLRLAIGLCAGEATAASPTSITLSLVAASGNQKGQATGKLSDSTGAPIAGAPVQLTVQPLDGPGVFAEYTASGTVPAGMTTALVGFRVNAECACAATSDFLLYQVRYSEGTEKTNRVPNGDFSEGLTGWGISGTAVTSGEPSDHGTGIGLHITADATQSSLANSSTFAVTTGAAYTVTFAARVAPASVGSGYFALIFFGQNTSARVQMALQPGKATFQGTTGDDGVFFVGLGGLPGSRLQLDVRYPGDALHAAATSSLTYVPAPTTLTVSPGSSIRSAGESQGFSASLTDLLGNVMTGQGITWSVSPPSIGKIDQTGLFTAGLSAGNGSVLARVNELDSSVPVAVTAANTLPSGVPVVVDSPRPQTAIVLSLGDYLATAGGSAYQAMVNALDSCKRLKASKLVIPPGRYFFDDPQIAANPYVPGVFLYQLSDLTIDGQGAEFVFKFPDHYGFILQDCNRLLIKNLVVDWDVVVASPGVVQREPNGQMTVRIADDFPVTTETRVEGITAFDLDRRIWLTNDGDDANVHDVTLIRPQTFASPSFLPFKEGTTVCIRHYIYHGNAFGFVPESSNISFEGITVYGSTGMGFSFFGGQGLRLSNCVIKRRPGTNRLVSTAADGVHIGQSVGDVIIEDCEVESMGDDAITLYGFWLSIVRKVDARTLVLRYTGFAGNIGDRSWIDAGADLKFSRLANLSTYFLCKTIGASYDATSYSFTATVDKDLPADLSPGDLVANLSRASSRFILRRNFVHKNRAHGLYLLTSDGLIEDNVFRDIPLSAIELSSDGRYWMEGPGCENVIVRGNALQDCGNERYYAGMGALSVTSYVPGQTVIGAAAVHQNVLIENNRIEQTPQLALLLASCDNLSVRENVVIDSNLSAFNGMGAGLGAKAAGSVMVTRASNVNIAENHQAMTQTTYDSGVYVDPGTTTGVTVEGNVNDKSVIYQIPVVLDVFGKPPSHYTSDAVLVNRSPKATRVGITYLPAPGTPGSDGITSIETIPAGREWRIPDVISYLRSKGYSIPASGPAIVGSLKVEFLDVTDSTLVFAGSRTSTPNGGSAGGSFGLFAPAVESLAGTYTSATIFGLREDDLFRSNLAVVDVPGGSGPAAVSLQIFDGDTGLPAGDPIPYALQPGDWKQFNSILGQRGVRNGYVTVTRNGGGSNRFLLYGVVNDGGSSGGGTSDGNFIGPDSSSGLIPIVLRVQSGTVLFTSELLLANPSSESVTATLTYTPSALLTSGPAVRATTLLGPGRQIRIPDVITYLKNLGLPLSDGGNQGGTLDVRGAIALARTSNPDPDPALKGTFGLAYPAYPAARRASTDAWVYGLRQDSQARSNVAIADGRVGDGTVISYVVEVYDSDSDNPAPVQTFGPIPLAGGQWYQVSSILGQAGVSHGYVHVMPQSGYSDFVAYGVINDGASPGQGTSDGSYVSMVVTRR